MSIGNDMVLCPVCEGKRGNKGCDYCHGEGRTTTFRVDYVDKKPDIEIREMAKIIEDLKDISSSAEVARYVLRALDKRGLLRNEWLSDDAVEALHN